MTDTASLRGHVTDIGSLWGQVTDSVSLGDDVTDTAGLCGHVSDTASLWGHVTDTVSLEGHVTDTAGMCGHVTDTASLWGHVTDTVMLEGHVTDTGSPGGHKVVWFEVRDYIITMKLTRWKFTKVTYISRLLLSVGCLVHCRSVHHSAGEATHVMYLGRAHHSWTDTNVTIQGISPRYCALVINYERGQAQNGQLCVLMLD